MTRWLCMVAVAWSWVGFPILLGAQESAPEKEAKQQIAKRAIRLVQAKCVSCHGPEKQEGNLRLDTVELLKQGGDRGSLLEHRDGNILLLRSIDGSDPDLQMPPKNPLSPSEIQLLRQWVAEGALWFDTKESVSTATGNAWEDELNPVRQRFHGERLDLWSLKPIERQSLPEPRFASWERSSLDRFASADWNPLQGAPSQDLEMRPLIRRLSFDLRGLPPSPEEVDEVLEDPSPDAIDRYIDRLLASPHYGRHFARMWLDVVRYSDSNGFDWDEYRKDAWRFRDYVIDSWNHDKPFQDFIVEQLAGDELVNGAPATDEEVARWIATGYLRLGPQDNAAPLFNEQDRARAELLADLTETTASAFLGMTLSCCRCHDHKSDPLTQEDHYRFRAFFACVEYGDKLGIDLRDVQESLEKHNQPIEKEIEELKKQVESIKDKKDSKRVELQKTIDRRKKELKAITPALLMTDGQDHTLETAVFFQGDHRSPRQTVQPGFFSVLTPENSQVIKPTNPKTSGRRLSLAQWIASPENRWTSRVIVNRLWQAQFGDGLVSSENDFGYTGNLPSNPAMLDWLAMQFMEHDWSLKHVQRSLVTSRLYRQQVPRQSNEYALRKSIRRLSAEQLRDATLACSGLLQDRRGGPPIWPKLPDDILQANPAFLDDNDTKTKGWYPSDANLQSVRSIYLIQKRTVRLPWLECFDLPENSVSCPQRESSIVPTQALTMLNGELTVECAHAMAQSLHHLSDADTFVEAVFRRTFQRLPTNTEKEASLAFLAEHDRTAFCRAILNTNEFAFYE